MFWALRQQILARNTARIIQGWVSKAEKTVFVFSGPSPCNCAQRPCVVPAWALLTEHGCLNPSSENVAFGIHLMKPGTLWQGNGCTYCVCPGLLLELRPDGKKTSMLGRPRRPGFRWALRKVGRSWDNHPHQCWHLFWLQDASPDAVTQVGVCHELLDLRLQQHLELLAMDPHTKVSQQTSLRRGESSFPLGGERILVSTWTFSGQGQMKK